MDVVDDDVDVEVGLLPTCEKRFFDEEEVRLLNLRSNQSKLLDRDNLIRGK